MIPLALVSALWALSFGLTAQVSALGSPLVTAARTLLAALVFLPFLRPARLAGRHRAALLGIGALQFGLMYALYIAAFRDLSAAEAALFTAFTPLLVALAGDALERRFQARHLVSAALAVAGAAVCAGGHLDRRGFLRGFLLMQVANFCFALGQVLYRRVAPRTGRPDRELMGMLYLGAAAAALLLLAPSAAWGKVAALTARQGLVLLYLGVVASGLGFFLFNAGARRVDLGTLAVFNNVKVPLALLASAVVFREAVDWPRLLGGGALIAGALSLNLERRP